MLFGFSINYSTYLAAGTDHTLKKNLEQTLTLSRTVERKVQRTVGSFLGKRTHVPKILRRRRSAHYAPICRAPFRVQGENEKKTALVCKIS